MNKHCSWRLEWDRKRGYMGELIEHEFTNDERMHELSADCWCNPEVEIVPAR